VRQPLMRVFAQLSESLSFNTGIIRFEWVGYFYSFSNSYLFFDHSNIDLIISREF